MPELPEVETIKCGLLPHIKDAIIQNVVVRQPQLRWPIPSTLSTCLNQQKIINVTRRAKYLLIQVSSGTLIIHLGMSGSLRILESDTPARPHDHVEILLSNKKMIRYHDPRRFGALLWTEEDPINHPLLKSIGVEPLDSQFTGFYLHQQALKRHLPIKTFIMNSKVVAGIGNIYAAEALFLAGVHPTLPAGELALDKCNQLVAAIKEVLTQAIAAGGTTLKDFFNSNGQPGYFSQKLYVYGRAKLPCILCSEPLQALKLGQRSTVFCAKCQSR